MTLAYLAAFATALCFGVSALFEDAAAKTPAPTGAVGPAPLLRVTTRLPFLVGIGLSLIGWVLSLVALRSLPLFAVQAVGASSIGVVVVLDRFRSHEPIPGGRGALLAALAAGLVAIAVAAEPSGPGRTPDHMDVAVWVGIGVVGLLWLLVGRSMHGDRAGAVLGCVSGLAYGGTALCARSLETDSTLRDVLRDPLTMALVPCAAIGVARFATALQRGSVSISVACQHATMTVVPSAVGLLVLDDRARPGFSLVAAGGFTTTVLAVVALTVLDPRRPNDVAALARGTDAPGHVGASAGVGTQDRPGDRVVGGAVGPVGTVGVAGAAGAQPGSVTTGGRGPWPSTPCRRRHRPRRRRSG